jgi:hypothetical protein
MELKFRVEEKIALRLLCKNYSKLDFLVFQEIYQKLISVE